MTLKVTTKNYKNSIDKCSVVWYTLVKSKDTTKHQKEIDKKVEEQHIQQELQALRAENKALKTLLKVYMK